MRTSEPLICNFRKLFRKIKITEGMRLVGETLGDRFIEDGYAYRIS